MGDKIRLLIVGAAIALTFVYGSTMSFTDFMWMKACIVIGIAGIYGFWRGFTGRR